MKSVKAHLKDRIREKEQNRMAQNSLLVFAMLSSFMTFFMLLLSYVKQYNPTFKLNNIFYFSTVCIVCASICIQLSYSQYRKDELTGGFKRLIVAAMLTIVFSVLQFWGWKHLKATYVSDKSHYTGYMSFLIISVFHFFHLMAGLVYVSILVKKHLSFQIHSKNINPIKYATIYWHFLGIIWITVFFIFQ